MEQGKIIDDILGLPPAAQQQVVDFVDFLRERYPQPRREKQLKQTPIDNEPFIGIWKDRKDMNDSGSWLRKVRESEWGGTS